MITIIHGNDLESSRNFYIDQRQKINNPIIFDETSFEYNKLFQTIEGNSFFRDDKFIFIENFFSSRKTNTNEFKQIADYINKNTASNITFWENKELTKAQSSSFKNSLIKVFNYPQILFLFLDDIKPGNQKLIELFHKLKENLETELIFYMLVRQFRLLLALSEGAQGQIEEVNRLAPWQRGKLQNQAKLFDTTKLKKIYKRIYDIDYKTKYGLSAINLSQTIDILLLDL